VGGGESKSEEFLGNEIIGLGGGGERLSVRGLTGWSQRKPSWGGSWSVGGGGEEREIASENFEFIGTRKP